MTSGHLFSVRTASIAATIAAATLVSACQENLEFTRRPADQPQTGRQPSVSAPVFVVARSDTAPLLREIEQRIPEQLLRVSLNLPRAACVERNNRKRCASARVTGELARRSAPVLKGTPTGFVVEIPASYDFTARGRGVARSVETSVAGDVRVSAPFTVALDSTWQPRVRFDGAVSVDAGNGVKVLERKLDIAPRLARKFQTRFRTMARAFERALDTTQAVRIVETTWRHLHYPVKMKGNPPFWLRGDPEGVAFGGLDVTAESVDLRIAVTGQISTFSGDRPVPLIAREMPSLSGEPISVARSRLVMPVDLPYAEIAGRIKSALKSSEPIRSSVSPGIEGFEVEDVRVFPSNGRLALAVKMTSKVEGSWLPLSGTAYLLATPTLNAATGHVTIKIAEFTTPTQSPDLFVNGRFVIPETPFVTAFRTGLNIKLKDRFADVLGDVNRAADVSFAEKNRLRGRFDDLSIHSMETRANGLRINLDVVGSLSVYPGVGNIAAELGQSQPVSAAQ